MAKLSVCRVTVFAGCLLAAAALWYTLRNASTVTSTINDLAGKIEESPMNLEQVKEQMVVTPVGAASTKVLEKKKKDNFLYMTMTEKCLPNHLTSSRAFANATACDCEVMVLSYKQPCNDASLQHVKYIFNSSTSWATGRNLLYELAMQKEKEFLYYIFMDDDIDLEMKTKDTTNPWRAFEKSLLLYEPAVAAPPWPEGGCSNWCLSALYSHRRRLGCPLKADEITDFIPTVHYDAAFEALHRRAVSHLLPHLTQYDEVSWWFAHRSVEMKSEIMFQGSVVAHTFVTSVNRKHRPYPKVAPTGKDLLPILEVIESQLPKDLKNSSVLQGWRERQYEQYSQSPTLCFPPLKPLSTTR